MKPLLGIPILINIRVNKLLWSKYSSAKRSPFSGAGGDRSWAGLPDSSSPLPEDALSSE